MLLVTAKNSLFKLMKLCLLTGIRGSADAFGATLSSPNGFSFACNAHNWGLSLKTDKSERMGSISSGLVTMEHVLVVSILLVCSDRSVNTVYQDVTKNALNPNAPGSLGEVGKLPTPVHPKADPEDRFTLAGCVFVC